MTTFSNAQDVYFEDFESSDGGWTTNGSRWTRTNSSFADNTTQHFRLTSFDNYSNDLNARLISPVIDLSGDSNMTLSFTIRYSTEVGEDGIRVQYSATGAAPYSVLGSVGEGQSWYNDDNVGSYNGRDGWTGDNTTWVRVSIPLPAALNKNPDARFRIQFKSGASGLDQGVAIDNFRIRGEESIAGITGLSLWLKASDGVYENSSGTDEAEDGDVVTYWNDLIAVNDAISEGSGGTAPTFDSSAINGNPAIRFFDDGGTSHLQTLRYDVEDNMSVLAVYSTAQSESGGSFWNSPALVGCEASGVTNDYALGLTNGQPFFKSDAGNAFGALSDSSYSDNNPHIAIGTRTKAVDGYQMIHIDGLMEDSTASGDISLFNPSHIGIGNQQDVQLNAQFAGYIAEVIIFDEALSEDDRVKVETYLAIKYGITLVSSDPGGCSDYVSSSSTIIYPSCGSHADYVMDVVGIGRDDAFAYNQTMSQSINTGSLFSLEHSSSFDTDESFFMMGSDGGEITSWDNTGFNLGYTALERTWRVEETGVVNDITISVESADLPVLPAYTYGYVLMVDSDNDFSSGAVSYPLTGTTTLSTTGISFNDGDYIRIVAASNVTSATGNYNTAATWALNVVPGSTEMAYVTNGHDLSIDGDISVGGFVLDINATLNLGSGIVELTDSCIVPLGGNTINTETSTVRYIKTGNQFVTGLNYYSLGVDDSGIKELKGVTRVANELEIISASSILKTNNLLTLESSSSGDASLLAVPNGAQIDGDVVIERYVGASSRSWWHMSTPHQGATAADWQLEFPITGDFTGADDLLGTNDPSIYSYDETDPSTSSADGWIAFPESNTSEAMVIGNGYRVFLRRSKDTLGSGHLGDTTIDLTGEPNIGNVSLNVTYTSNSDADTAAAGWNFVGNPYASAIDWDAAGWTKTNVADAIYVWDAINKRYTTYVYGVGTHGGNGRIASGQAFWVRSRSTDPVLTATEQVKTTTSTPFLKGQSNTVANLLRVEIQDDDKRSDLAIRFSDDASPGFDNNRDAYYWGGDYPVNLCSYDEYYNYYSVNSLPLDHEDDIPLWLVHPNTEKTYSLNFSGLTSFELAPGLSLTDLYLGETIEIYDGMVYDFDYEGTPASHGSSRFIINKKANVISSTTGEYAIEEVVLVPNPVGTGNRVKVFLPSSLKSAQVNVTNMSGVLVKTIFQSPNERFVELSGLAKGVYMIEIHGSQFVAPKKLIVE